MKPCIIIGLIIGGWLSSECLAQVPFMQKVDESTLPKAAPEAPTAQTLRESYGDFLKTAANAEHLTQWNLLQAGLEKPTDPYVASDILNHVVQRNGDLAKAMLALTQEKNQSALDVLKPLAAHTDPWIAAQADGLRVRALTRLGHHEEAYTLARALQHERFAVYHDPLNLAIMVADLEFELLQFDTAMRDYQLITKRFPAMNTLQKKHVMVRQVDTFKAKTDDLNEAKNIMAYSKRRVSMSHTGEKTQTEQKRILSALDKAIQKAEEQQQQSGGGGGGGGGSQGQSQGPQGMAQNGQSGGPPAGGASSSNLPDGSVGASELGRPMPKADDGWSKMRPKEREAVLNQLKQRYPNRYRAMVEQYYKGLQSKSE